MLRRKKERENSGFLRLFPCGGAAARITTQLLSAYSQVGWVVVVVVGRLERRNQSMTSSFRASFFALFERRLSADRR
jgi:hypothetical protein